MEDQKSVNEAKNSSSQPLECLAAPEAGDGQSGLVGRELNRAKEPGYRTVREVSKLATCIHGVPSPSADCGQCYAHLETALARLREGMPKRCDRCEQILKITLPLLENKI